MTRLYFPFRPYGARALAIMLPVILLALVWIVVVAPLIGLFDWFEEERDSLRANISAERVAISAAPSWANALSALRKQETQTAGTRVETSEALAEAGLQNDVQQMAEAVGGQVISVETMPAVLQSDYQAISIRISLSLPLPELAQLLREIEGHVPYMFISSVSLQVADPAFDQSADPNSQEITMLCTVTAYRLP